VFKADKIVEMNKRRIDKSDYTSVGDINLEGNLNLAPENNLNNNHPSQKWKPN
jgi:hypothetical protein